MIAKQSFDINNIIREHRDFIVVNKPAGIDVHNKPGNLIHRLELTTQTRFKPVHRLDQETSGLILLAKTAKATSSLQVALSSSLSQKSYLAVIKSKLKPRVGQWTMQITNKAEGRRQPAGPAKKRVSAHTEYEVLDQNQWLSLISCTLHTGRQHQIRKHCALAQCPIIGDLRYGDPKHARLMAHKYKFNGLALHAYYLKFNYQGEHFIFSKKPPEMWNNFNLTYINKF